MKHEMNALAHVQRHHRSLSIHLSIYLFVFLENVVLKFNLQIYCRLNCERALNTLKIEDEIEKKKKKKKKKVYIV